MRLRVLLLVICALAVAAAAPALAQAPLQGEALEEQTRRLSAELRCPVCQGVSVADSPTELAQQMRAVVREQLAEGKTPTEVKAFFVSRYGEWILLQPEPQGFNLLVYLLPVLGLLLGGVFIAFTVRRWTRRPDAPAPIAPPGAAPGTRAPRADAALSEK